MGHKTHPIGFRLGVSKDWQSRWFAPSGKEYKQFVWEDLQIRSSILEQYPDASISKIDIERNCGFSVCAGCMCVMWVYMCDAFDVCE